MVKGDFAKKSAQQQWERVLVDGHASLVAARRVFRYLPAAPRCKLCNNPFGGVTGHIFAAAGFRPSRKNPNLCTRCCDALPAGGAEVDIAVRQRAVEAGIALLQAVGYGTEEGPWLHLGVAVNAGIAYVGNVGGAVVDFTALGDPVNVAARMQQHAVSGELLVAQGVADNLTAHARRRTLILRGHEQPIEVFAFSG